MTAPFGEPVQPPPAAELPVRMRVLANGAARLGERLRDVAALAAVGADVRVSLREAASLAASLAAELAEITSAAPISD